MSEELKPCPFCGKEPQVVTMPDGEVHVYDGTSRDIAIGVATSLV